MHPLERLRSVARIEGADPTLLAREAAGVLAQVAAGGGSDLVPACRRLVERHPGNGALWWLAARVLCSAEPAEAAREADAELATDPTSGVLAAALPEPDSGSAAVGDLVGAERALSVLVVGWSDLLGTALRRRADLEVLVVDSGGEGAAFCRHLAADGHAVAAVPDSGVAPAAGVAGVVLLEALAAGPGGVLAAPGSYAAAAVARHAGGEVWAVPGVGRVLPAPLWDGALRALDASGREPWEREVELVPADLLSLVVSRLGARPPVEGLSDAECDVPPPLLRLPGR